MGNLMTSMWVGVSGLQTSQNAINTTSHNLTNANTPGYVRQQVLFKDFSYNKVGQSANYSHNVGLGVATEVVKQARDQFLDEKYREEAGRQGYYNAQYYCIGEVEDIYGELEGVSFRVPMTDLKNALQEMAKTPDDPTTKATFVKKAEAFLERANKIAEQVRNYQVSLNSQITDKVNQINFLGDQIAALNVQIMKNEAGGVERANDLRDARNSYLDELGKLADISYYEDGDGMVNVKIEEVSFVSRSIVSKMGLTTEKPNLRHVNDLTDRIYNLNSKIKTETNPAIKADLEKDRQKMLDLLDGYIDFTSTNNADGTITVTTSQGTLIDGALTETSPANRFVAEKMCSTTDMLKPIWISTNDDVFNFSRVPNQQMGTDCGSLKGLLISRGSHEVNYTDIPVRNKYPNDESYQAAIEAYNTEVQSSVISTTQAQFDQLIHGMVTALNNIFAPNKEIELADGTKITILDEENAPVGMDKNHTQGEELFVRKGTPRYTTKNVTTFELDASGNKIVDAADPTGFKTKQVNVRVYNEEDPKDKHSLYTLGQVDINTEILKNYSKLPINKNGDYKAFDKEVTDKLIKLFDSDFVTLGPNNETMNTYDNYYTNFIGEIANRGKTLKSISEDQQVAVNNLDNARSSVMGVSTDEELTNLIKFQHAYNANARYVNVVSEMLEHLVTRL